MQTVRRFSHDGSDFEITAGLRDDMWEVVVRCDGNRIGGLATVAEEVRGDAARQNIDLLEELADEWERLVRAQVGLIVRPV